MVCNHELKLLIFEKKQHLFTFSADGKFIKKNKFE